MGLIWQSVRGSGECLGEILSHVGGSSMAASLCCSLSRLEAWLSMKAVRGIETGSFDQVVWDGNTQTHDALG